MPGGRPIIDISGVRFGKLVAVSVERRSGGGTRKPPLWKLECDCGGVRFAEKGVLITGRIDCCSGCAKKRSARLHQQAGFGARGVDCVNFKHGGAIRGNHTKEYKTWESMIRRCEMPSQRHFDRYGGRGISVCERWRHDYKAFLADIGPAPSPSHTIERVDFDGNYEPSNCRWATMAEQARNRSSNRMLTFNGRSLTMIEVAESCGVKYGTLWRRLKLGWPIEKATQPHRFSPPGRQKKVK
jgi:hypothetical protein